MKKFAVASLIAAATIVASPVVMAASNNASSNASSNAAKTVSVKFAKGASSANYSGKIKGNKYDSYNFYAKKGQKLNVTLSGGNVEPYLFNKKLSESVNVGQYSPEVDSNGAYTLPYSGQYELRILQPRSQANQGKSPKYWLKITIR